MPQRVGADARPGPARRHVPPHEAIDTPHSQARAAVVHKQWIAHPGLTVFTSLSWRRPCRPATAGLRAPRHRCRNGFGRSSHEDVERHALVEALKMSNWVQKDAAELLSISPRVMNYKIKTLGIEFPRGRRAQAMPIAAAS